MMESLHLKSDAGKGWNEGSDAAHPRTSGDYHKSQFGAGTFSFFIALLFPTTCRIPYLPNIFPFR